MRRMLAMGTAAMSSGRGRQPNHGIVVQERVAEAYGTLFHGWRDFLQIAGLPILSAAVVGALGVWLATVRDLALWRAAAMLVSLMIGASFAATWQRYILLGERPAGGFLHLRFGDREALHFFYLLLILLPLNIANWLGSRSMAQMAAEQPVHPLLPLFVMAIIVFGVIIVVRFALVLPMLAVDARPSLRNAWQLSAGSAGKLFAIFALTLLPPSLVGLLALPLLGMPGGNALFLLWAKGADYVGFALALTALCAIYRQTPGVPGAAPVPQEPTGGGDGG